MAKVMDFNATKGSDWYKKGDFDTSNPELNIRQVRFTKPNGNHERVVANAVIELDNDVTLFGTIYLARNGQDLTFGVDQRKYQVDGQDRYTDINVRIPLKIQAFVLNQAEKRMTDGPAVPPAQSSAPATPAKPEQPAQADMDKLANMLGSLSEEQLLSMLSQ